MVFKSKTITTRKRLTMSQLILTAVGDIDGSLELSTDASAPLAADDLLVEIEAAPINHADFLLAAGWYAMQPQVPFAMGTEGAGLVVRAGSAAHQHLVGRRVIVLPTNEQGTWADRVVVAARNVVPVSNTGDPVQQAMLTVNPATAYLLLNRFVQLKPGDWVGQDLGNSAVGQSVIALARRAGVRTLSVVRTEQAAEQLRKIGADAVLIDGDDLPQRIADTLGGRSLRLALTGGATVEALAGATESGGTVVAYSSVTGQSPALPLGDLVFRELTLRGFWVIKWLREASRTEIEATYGLLGALLDEGVLHAEVDSTYPLDDHQRALARARENGRSGKVLFTPRQDRHAG
jgi:NADPH:quinone reductase-like Zn-dependent oxidoreductase